ncbi:MAG: CotH kinase family protein [Paludibacteraceae bacterium]|nr:CotH kinase family protein [Paludibacteraceae bacterium]
MSYSTEDLKKVSFSKTVSANDVDLKTADKIQTFNQLFSMSVKINGKEVSVPFADAANPTIAFPPRTESFTPSFSTSGSHIFVNGKMWNDGDKINVDKDIVIKVAAFNGDIHTYRLDAISPSSPILELKTDGLSADWSDLKSISIDGKALGACEIKAKGGEYNPNEKNSFNIKFDEKQEILGITKNKRWTLEANAGDVACIRGLLGYNIANRISGSWNPQAKKVALIVDGKYVGCYLLSEQPRVCKGRVENGNLMSIEDKADQGDDHFSSSIFNSVFIMKDPETGMDGVNLVRTRDLVEKLEQAIMAKKWSEVHSMLDIQSVAEWVVVNEVAKNDKAFASDTYLYIDDDKKIHFIPSTQSAKAFNADSDYEGFTAYDRNWISLLKNDSDFTSAVKKAFGKISSSEKEILSWIDEDTEKTMGDALANASICNRADYDKEIANLKAWLSARIKWLSNQWK